MTAPAPSDPGRHLRARRAEAGADRIPWTGATAPATGAGSHPSSFSSARSDARRFLDVLADPAPAPTGDRLSVIGFSTAHWAGEADPEVVAAVEAAARRLEAAGHRIEPIEPPVDYEQLMATWHGLFSRWVAAEAHDLSGRLARLIDDTTVEPVTMHVVEEVARLSPEDLLMTERRRAEITRLAGELAECTLPTPTLGRVTIPLGRVGGDVENIDDYLRLNDELFPYNYLFNVAGWPSLSVPFSRSAASTTAEMPIGVQLSAGPGTEHRLLDLAETLLAE